MAKKEKTLSEHSLVELEAKYDEACKELYNLKCEYRLNRQLKKPHLLKTRKKDIARILTFYNAKSKLATKGDKK